VSIHADEVLNFRFGTPEQAAQWRPLAQDGADVPVALRVSKPGLARLGPGETADFTYVPTKAGEMQLEVWIDGGGHRVVVPVEVRDRQKAEKRASH
jgi:hypothetical protein